MVNDRPKARLPGDCNELEPGALQLQRPPGPGEPMPGAELLETGQEEVFSRTEVELGAVEHDVTAGAHKDDRR